MLQLFHYDLSLSPTSLQLCIFLLSVQLLFHLDLPLYNIWSLRLWLIYAYPSLSPLSCTTFRFLTVVAGLSQALLVFNLSYVWLLSLRLDLLYQYQAIASKVPCDQFSTDSFTCEPPILRLIAWLHWTPLKPCQMLRLRLLKTRQAGLTDTWLTLT